MEPNRRPGPLAGLVRSLVALAVGLALAGAAAHVLVVGAARASDDGWELVHADDGVRVERRPGRRSACDEVRISRRVDVSPEVALDVLWEARDERPFVDDLVESRVLRESATERLVYGRVAVPWVRDRAYVVRISRHVDPAGGGGEVRFALAEDEPLPAARHTARVAVLEGAWRIEPLDGALQSRLVYRAEVDPGEGVPAWLASRLQRQRAVKVVERYAKRIQEHAGRVTASAASGL
jgi:hypothetical protein